MYAPAYLQYFTNRKKVSNIGSRVRKAGLCVLINLVISASLTFGIEFTDISGDISEVQFDTLRYFRVIGDVEIPAGKTVRIPAGTVILFEDEKTMQINGGCSFEGNPHRKVILSTTKDLEFNPENPVKADIGQEWRGISISKLADSVIFQWTDIRYADKPIETSSSRISLQGVTPIDAGSPIFIRDTYVKGPIFYPAFQSTFSVQPKKRMHRVALSFTSATTAAAAAVFLTCNRIEYKKYQSIEKNYLNNKDIYPLLPASYRDGSHFDEMRNDFSNVEKSSNAVNGFRTASILTGIISVLSAASLCFSFVLDW